MADVAALIEMQEGRLRRPWRCRFGIHDYRETHWLITTGTAHCSRCGAGLTLSIWGAFPMDRDDAVKSLRRAQSTNPSTQFDERIDQ